MSAILAAAGALGSLSEAEKQTSRIATVCNRL